MPGVKLFTRRRGEMGAGRDDRWNIAFGRRDQRVRLLALAHNDRLARIGLGCDVEAGQGGGGEPHREALAPTGEGGDGMVARLRRQR